LLACSLFDIDLSLQSFGSILIVATPHLLETAAAAFLMGNRIPNRSGKTNIAYTAMGNGAASRPDNDLRRPLFFFRLSIDPMGSLRFAWLTLRCAATP
jgi:hypothetical protein